MEQESLIQQLDLLRYNDGDDDHEDFYSSGGVCDDNDDDLGLSW